MGVWFGYLQVPAGGTYELWVEGGMGAVSVPWQGFVTFGGEGERTSVTFPGAGDYPLNLYAAGQDPAAAFRCTGGAALRAMGLAGGGV